MTPAAGGAAAPAAVVRNATGGKISWTPDGRSLLYGGLDLDGGDIDVFSVGALQPGRREEPDE